MNQTLRVVLIIFGAIGVLCVAVVVAGIILLPKLVKSAAGTRSPVAIAAVAKKFGHFDVPPGYRIVSAIDLGLTQQLTLAKGDGANSPAMQIRLQQSVTPTTTDSVTAGMRFTTGFAERFGRCKMKESSETVLLHGTSHRLGIFDCSGEKHDIFFEGGQITPRVSVIATAAGSNAFDHEGFLRLVRSL